MVTNHRDADDRNKRTLFQNKLMFGLFPAPTGKACGHPMTNQRVPLGRNEAYVTAELMTDVLLLRSAVTAGEVRFMFESPPGLPDRAHCVAGAQGWPVSVKCQIKTQIRLKKGPHRPSHMLTRPLCLLCFFSSTFFWIGTHLK